MTDHVWSLREVLLFQVPLWPQPQVLSGPEPLSALYRDTTLRLSPHRIHHSIYLVNFMKYIIPPGV